ncbi:di-trans,poly-cis-decaprenylcistransferase [Candidatus Woesearchaeota archaeon]|nr:di-trans,poly-cis-decaprenylcistransferase [Candidatus Woesearchaeota archaeon]
MTGNDLIGFRLPTHIALVTKGKNLYAKKHNIPIKNAYKRSNKLILETIESSVKLRIPITTFYLLSTKTHDLEYFSILVDSLSEFFNELSDNGLIHKNMVKVSVLGKWYDLPGKLVDSIKNLIEKTRDYDAFFVNLCLNYDGQEEIVDAVRLISRQIKAGKLDAELINKELIKENIYSSYFLPPDLIIINGPKRMSDLLLWDSPDAKVCFTNKLWPDFDMVEFMDAIKEYGKGG